MKSSAKKRILIIVLILVIIIVALLIWRNSRKENQIAENNGGADSSQTDTNEVEEFVQVLDDGSKLNTSSELQTEKTLDGLKMTNIQLKASGGITTLLADVENTTDEKIEEKMVRVEILDKQGDTITEVKGVIDSVDPGKTVQLNIAVTADVANAYDFKISNE